MYSVSSVDVVFPVLSSSFSVLSVFPSIPSKSLPQSFVGIYFVFISCSFCI